MQKQLSLEHDPVKRHELLDRMLFLIEAQSRARKIAEEGGPPVNSQDVAPSTD